MKQAVLFVQWLDTTFKSNANKGRSIHISSSTTKHKIHGPHALGQVIWRKYCFVFAGTDLLLCKYGFVLCWTCWLVYTRTKPHLLQERSRTCCKNEAALTRTKLHLQERSRQNQFTSAQLLYLQVHKYKANADQAQTKPPTQRPAQTARVWSEFHVVKCWAWSNMRAFCSVAWRHVQI